MKWFEILIIIAVSAIIITTFIFSFKKKSSKKGGCSGHCSKCKCCIRENNTDSITK